MEAESLQVKVEYSLNWTEAWKQCHYFSSKQKQVREPTKQANQVPHHVQHWEPVPREYLIPCETDSQGSLWQCKMGPKLKGNILYSMEVVGSDGSFFLESIFERRRQRGKEKKRMSLRYSSEASLLNTGLGTTLKCYQELWTQW